MDYGWDEKRLANASWASYIATGNMLPRPAKNPNTCGDYIYIEREKERTVEIVRDCTNPNLTELRNPTHELYFQKLSQNHVQFDGFCETQTLNPARLHEILLGLGRVCVSQNPSNCT